MFGFIPTIMDAELYRCQRGNGDFRIIFVLPCNDPAQDVKVEQTRVTQMYILCDTLFDVLQTN
jgi:hypothetical protein